MEPSTNDFILRREYNTDKSGLVQNDDVFIFCDLIDNLIEVNIKPNWSPTIKNQFKNITNITEKKLLVLNLNHPNSYGHIYTEVLSELYAVDETYPEYDCIVTVLTPLMDEIIKFFNLKLSNKVRFINSTEMFLLNFEELRIVNHSPKTYINKAKNAIDLKIAFHSLRLIPKRDRDILLYCSRAGHCRRLTQENETQIIEVLKQYALENDLEFFLLTGQESNGTATTISKQYELFSSAKLIVGVHGGAMSNLIFLDTLKNPKIIEFCPIVEKSFNKLFDGAILKFAEYHQILYQLSPNTKTLAKQEIMDLIKNTESTINISELKEILTQI